MKLLFKLPENYWESPDFAEPFEGMIKIFGHELYIKGTYNELMTRKRETSYYHEAPPEFKKTIEIESIDDIEQNISIEQNLFHAISERLI